MKKSIVAVAMAGSIAVGGAAGLMLFGPGPAGAATTTTTSTTVAPRGTFQGNEDPTHESGESAEREAAETSGRGLGPGGHHGWNEDATHEANESPQREAQETANPNGGSATTSTTAAPTQRSSYLS